MHANAARVGHELDAVGGELADAGDLRGQRARADDDPANA